MIVLMHVEGLSSSDLPLFVDPSSRNHWANAHTVATISNSYFPPYYTNKIKFTTDDVDFDTQFNYLYLEFRDKRYYYFVEDISYISEDVIEVSITMDTLITYFFEIKVGDGEICRKFIPRLNSNGDINRNYIRENVSNGVKKITYLINERETFSEYPDFQMLVIIGSKDFLFDWLDEGKYSYKVFDAVLPLSLVAAFIPLYRNDGSEPIQVSFDGTSKPPTNIFTDASLWMASNSPSVHHIFFFPFIDPFVGDDNVLKKIETRGDGVFANIDGTRWAVYDMNSLASGGKAIAPIQPDSVHPDAPNTIRSVQYTYDVPLNLKPIDNLDFDAWQEPAIFDNNYLCYEFGEPSTSISCNLFDCVSKTIINEFTYDFIQGTRVYRQNGSKIRYGANFNADYNVSTSISVEFPLSTDMWLQYFQQNKATLVGSIASDCVKGLGVSRSFTTSNIETHETGIRSQVMKDFSRNTETSTPDGNTLILNKREAVRRTYYEPRPYSKNKTGTKNSETTSTSSPDFSATLGTLTDMANAVMAPDNLRSLGTLLSEYIYKRNDVRFVVYEAEDLQHVGLYYHKNGVLVSYNYTRTTFQLFSDYLYSSEHRVRKYFNVCKFKTCDCHLRNAPESQEIITDLNKRLMDGFRTWELGEDFETLMPIGYFYKSNPDRS